MKILFVGDEHSVHTRRWIQYFVDKGDEITIFSSKNSEGLSVLRKIFLLIEEIGKLKPLVRDLHPDIVHVHFVNVDAFAVARTGFHPFVLTAWGSDILVLPKISILTRFIVKYSLKRADFTTCDAKHLIPFLEELGADPRRIGIINFGTDVKKFSPGEKNIEIKKSLQLNDAPVVISVRNFEPIYNVESLILAIPGILEKIPSTQFIIAGKGSEDSKLKDLARSLDVSDHIHFVGQIPNDQLPAYFRSSDVYVSTSLSDGGLSASTAEAMSCGLPVVITDFGDNGMWVRNNENGFLVPLKSPDRLAEKVILLLQNPDLRRQYGMNNRKVIEEKNNYYREMGKMESIYKDLTKVKEL